MDEDVKKHKWFEFGKDSEGNDLPKTVISREYSSEWKVGDEPYYPVNDEKNGALYQKYKQLAQKRERRSFSVDALASISIMIWMRWIDSALKCAGEETRRIGDIRYQSSEVSLETCRLMSPSLKVS